MTLIELLPLIVKPSHLNHRQANDVCFIETEIHVQALRGYEPTTTLVYTQPVNYPPESA